MGGAGSGRTSGEWAAPVTQGQFDGFAQEVRNFMGEQRTQNGVIMSMLSEGQATMAVLRRDTAEFKKRSDEQSSKINLLAQKDAVRVERERHDETVALPVPTPVTTPKQTFTDLIKDKFLSALAMVVVAIVMATGWTVLREYVIAHPNAPTEEGSAPSHHEHERGREPPQAIPASAPTTTPAAHP